MAAPSRQAPKPLSRRLREKPQAFEFLQALLLLERERPDATPLGQGSSPDDEALRLRGPLTPTFAASQVERLEEQQGQVKIHIHSHMEAHTILSAGTGGQIHA